MTIHLHTGVPGSCKTLHVVDAIQWKSEYKGRPVYAHAIEGWERAVQIRCHHAGCRTCRHLTDAEKAKMPAVEQWQEWAEAGALIVIDEAHYAFPSRREKECPLYIQRLTEHRHDGLDFWLCTPNANLMDINVRRLVERHEHFVNGITGRFRISHTECMDTDERLKLGVKERFFMGPLKRSFNVYRSADMHVKIKTSVPRFAYIIPGLVVIGLLAFVAAKYLSTNLRRSQEDKPAIQQETESVPEPVSRISGSSLLANMRQQEQFSPVVSAIADMGKGTVAACLSSASYCECFDDAGFELLSTEAVCRTVVEDGINPRSLEVVNGRIRLPRWAPLSAR